MNSVGAPDHDRILMLHCPGPNDIHKLLEILNDYVHGLFQKKCKARVQDVGRGEAQMDIS